MKLHPHTCLFNYTQPRGSSLLTHLIFNLAKLKNTKTKKTTKNYVSDSDTRTRLEQLDSKT